MNTAIANVLNKVLGDFVEGFNPEQLNLSVFSGKLRLENLKLKPSALEQFGLPFELRYGMIKSIGATIPWTALASSPLRVEVEGVYLLLQPKSPNLWNREREENNQISNKFSRLDRFEFLNSDHLAVAKSPGFIEKLATKIVDNLQISLKGVYIRLEDFSSSSEPFAVGFIVKSAEADTCNSSWTPEFVIDSPITYKSVRVDDLAVYIDYGEGFEVDSSKIIGKTPEQSFYNLSRQESSLHFLIQHRFLLETCSCEWKFTINKDSSDLSRPSVVLEMLLGKEGQGIAMGTELKQMTHVVKFIEFYNHFDTFQQGVVANMQHQAFSDFDGEDYRSLYIQWKLQSPDDRSDFDPKLKASERVRTYEDIVKQRLAAREELKLAEKEEEVKKEISSVSAAPSSSGLKSFFGFGKSKQIQEQEEQERKKRLEQATLELQKLKERRDKFREDLEAFIENVPQPKDFPRDFEKIRLNLLLPDLVWTIKGESGALRSAHLQQLAIEAHIQVSGLSASVSSQSFFMQDYIEVSEVYPHFIEMNSFLLRYTVNPEEGKTIHIAISDSFCVVNFSSFFKLISEVKTVIVKELDVDYYSRVLSDAVEKYIQQGKVYMQSIAKEGFGVLRLTLDCKAPCIFFPFDISEKSALVMDFGTLHLGTQRKQAVWTTDIQAIYDYYQCTVSQVTLATVWDFSVARDWRISGFTPLVTPSPFTINIGNAVTKDWDPVIDVSADINTVEVELSDKQLLFILLLQEKVMKLKEDFFPETEIKADLKEIQDGNQELFAEKLKRQGKLLGQRLEFGVKSVVVRLKQGTDYFSAYSAAGFHTEVRLLPHSVMKVKCSMNEISVEDTRPGQSYPLLVSMQGKLGSDVSVIDVDLSINPTENAIEINANFWCLRVLLNMDFLMMNLRFFSSPIDEIAQRAALGLTKPVESLPKFQSLKHASTFPMRTRHNPSVNRFQTIVVHCSDFSLIVPEAITSYRVLRMAFNGEVKYTSKQVQAVEVNEEGLIMDRVNLETEDEVRTVLGPIEIAVGTITNYRDLGVLSTLHPYITQAKCISMELRRVKDQTQTMISVQATIPELSAALGFVDAQVLFNIKESFAPPSQSLSKVPNQPKVAEDQSTEAVTYSISLTLDAVTAALIDDTDPQIKDLLRLQLVGFSLNADYSPSFLQAGCNVELTLSHFNSAVAAYEPLIEDWTLEFRGDQDLPSNGNLLSLTLISNKVLALNISYSMSQVLALVLQKLREGIQSWKVSPDSSGKGVVGSSGLQYKIKNKLGTPVVIYIEGTGQEWNLGDKQGVLVADDKWSLNQGPNPVRTLALRINAFGLIRGILVDEAGLKGYTFQGSDRFIICNITYQRKYRLISLESAYKICNNIDARVTISSLVETQELTPGKSLCFPIHWEIGNVRIQTENGFKNLLPLGQIQINERTFVVLDKVLVEGQEANQEVYMLNPPVTVQNLLPGTLKVWFSSDPSIKYKIASGAETKIYTQSSVSRFECRWKLKLGWSMALSSALTLQRDGETLYKLNGLPQEHVLAVSMSTQEIFRYGNLDLSFEKLKGKEFSGKTLQAYAPLWIVNHTEYPFDLSDLSDTTISIDPTQFLLADFSSPHIKLRINEHAFGRASKWSNNFAIDTSGLAGSLTLETSSKTSPLLTLGIYVEQGTWPLIKTRVIHVYPRFVIQNSLPYPIFLRQHKQRDQSRLEPGTHCAFQCSSGKVGSYLEVSVDGELWSSAFSIEDLAAFQIRFPTPAGLFNVGKQWWLPNRSTGLWLYAQVSVSTENEAVLFTKLSPPETPDFLILNETPMVLTAVQEASKELLSVSPGTSLPFVYDDQIAGKRKVKLTLQKSHATFNIEKIGKSKKKLGGFCVETCVQSASRVLRVYQSNDRASSEMRVLSTSRFSNLRLALHFQGLELALVDDQPREKVLVTVADIDVGATSIGSQYQATEQTEQYLNVIMKTIQIDNMDSKQEAFDVIFSQVRREDEEPTPLLQLEVKRTIERKAQAEDFFQFFEYIRLSLQETQVRLHQDTVLSLANLIQKVVKAFEQQLKPHTFDMVATFDSICPALAPIKPEFILVSRPQKKSYFQAIFIYGTVVNLWIQTSREKVEEGADPSKSFKILQFLRRFATSLINVSNASLKFSNVMLEDSFSTGSEIGSKVTHNYKNQGIRQFYRIIGSSDMLGNPIGLINKLGSGVFEFFNEPRKGLLKGPEEFGNGVRKGVKSLVSNVVSGGLGSVSKITGSFYGLIRQAQGDEEGYERINRPDSISSGVLEGMKGGLTDLAEGISGIVRKPMEGIKTGGFVGFFKGVGTGLVGAVTSPVSAVLRAGTTVASSVAQSASNLSNRKVIPVTRVRYPRQTNSRRVLEPYNESAAHAQTLLRHIKQFHKEKPVYSAMVKNEAFILTPKHVLMVTSLTQFTDMNLAELVEARLIQNVETALYLKDVHGKEIYVRGKPNLVLEIQTAVLSFSQQFR